MWFKIDVINILVLLVWLINNVYGLIVYSRNRKNKINFAFFMLTICVGFWGISMFGYRGFLETAQVVIMAHWLYFSAATIPLAFLYFAFIFPDPETKLTWKQKYLVPIPFIAAAIVSFLPNVLIYTVDLHPGMESFIVFNRGVHLLYGLYIMGYFSWAYLIVFNKYRKAEGVEKAQLLYIFLGTLFSTMIGLVTNLILPFFGIFVLNWAGQVGVIIMITLIFYSILKYHLFNIRVITTELFTFSLWVFILIRLFLSVSVQDEIINGSLLFATVVVGVLLIRAVIREVNQREKIQALATDLEKSNAELATLNDRLKELDVAKSEFLSLATHQLRAPITAIKGYASLVAEGDFGAITPQLKEAVDVIQQSSNSMAVMVDDFLNISRIEQGRMKYDYVVADAAVLAQEVVNELRPAVEKKGLQFSIEFDTSQKFDTRMDLGKMKQAITNLIDNAMKYTPKGWIKVGITRQAATVAGNTGAKILIEVSDNGIGISAENIPKLFAKFSRAKNGVTTNVTGTGLGLFVVKQMVEAQGGRVWVTSDGEGKGSIFHIELAAFA